EMTACSQDVISVHRCERDEDRAIRLVERRELLQGTSNIVLLCREETFKPKISCRRLSVELASGRKTFLDAQHRHGLRSIGLKAQWVALAHQVSNEGVAIIGWHADFIAELARERDAIKASGKS